MNQCLYFPFFLIVFDINEKVMKVWASKFGFYDLKAESKRKLWSVYNSVELQ